MLLLKGRIIGRPCTEIENPPGRNLSSSREKGQHSTPHVGIVRSLFRATNGIEISQKKMFETIETVGGKVALHSRCECYLW